MFSFYSKYFHLYQYHLVLVFVHPPKGKKSGGSESEEIESIRQAMHLGDDFTHFAYQCGHRKLKSHLVFEIAF